jgi:glycosyltransferase involved in cell wall biosynthesis
MSRYPKLARAVDGVDVWAGQETLSASGLSERFADHIAVVIPAHNEADNLDGVLRRIPERICGVPANVLLVDDGSCDGTADAALAAGVVVAQLPEKRGGGAALWTGYSLMLDARARVVVTMDADGQHRPEELERVVEPVLSGRADLSQGSRILGSAQPGAFAREMGIAFFNRFVRVLTGLRITDCSNGFRAVLPEVLAELDLRQPQFHAAEFLIEAVTRGYRLEEVPVRVLRRQQGVSKKPPALRYGWGFHSAIISALRRAFVRSVSRRRLGRPTAVDQSRDASCRKFRAWPPPAGWIGVEKEARGIPLQKREVE